MSDSLRFLGLARKAGRVALGDSATEEAVRGGKARLILTASDISGNSLERAERFAAAAGSCLVRLPYSKADIGAALGRSTTAMAAVTDLNFAAGFVSKLCAEFPERYDDAASQMSGAAE